MRGGNYLGLRFSVDIGGTFTDIVALDETTGRISLAKVETTPKYLAIGVKNTIDALDLNLEQVSLFLHGTTQGINALLQRKGAKTGLITTKGFRDVLEIARINRTEMYNLTYRKPTPLVDRYLRFGVEERIDLHGKLKKELNVEDVKNAIRKMKKRDVDSIAVCLINSYANPKHEKKIAEIIEEEYADAYVSLSHEITREHREYERTNTTVLDAYIKPIIFRYLKDLEDYLAESKFAGRFLIMRSGGGVMTSTEMRDRPVYSILSGPAGGVVGALHIGKLVGCEDSINVSMGGTSFDVSLIHSGQFLMKTEAILEGYAVMIPFIDIHTVGAGGGSIAWIDSGGAPHVGPRSAAAEPGPVCYGKGGTEPTVTDADVLLGRINPDYFLGGEMKLDVKATEKAIKDKIADVLRMDVVDAAAGILKIVETNMSHATRGVSIEKGSDPREFTMIAYGAAGPTHAMAIAKELNMSRVIVTPAPGNFSAWGMLMADLRHDQSLTYVTHFDKTTIKEINGIFTKLEEENLGALRRDGVPRERMSFLRRMDMRYYGQEHTVRFPVPYGVLTDKHKEVIVNRFHDAHEFAYGHCFRGEPTQFVHYRSIGIGSVLKPVLRKIKRGPENPEKALKGKRLVYFEKYEDFLECEIYERDRLLAGNVVSGPAVVEEPTSTTVVHPDQTLRVSEFGLLIIEVGS